MGIPSERFRGHARSLEPAHQYFSSRMATVVLNLNFADFRKGLRLSGSFCPNLTVRPLDSSLMGESAAILTSYLWTFSSILFTSAGRRFGSISVNAYRTIMAIELLICAHAVLLGTVLPLATSGQWLWLGLSGIVGLGIGDFALFAA